MYSKDLRSLTKEIFDNKVSTSELVSEVFSTRVPTSKLLEDLMEERGLERLPVYFYLFKLIWLALDLIELYLAGLRCRQVQ